MKKILPLLFLVLISFVAISQKNSSQPLAVNFEVTPTSPIAATLRSYNSVITTSLNPFSAAEASRITNMEQARASRLAELSTKYLSLYNGLQFTAVNAGEDISIRFNASDAKRTFVNPTPFNEMTMEDEWIRYTISATLTVKDKTGAVLLERTLADPGVEGKMTKAYLFFNPLFKAKIALFKNNPEKIKKLTDEMLDNIDHVLLEDLLLKARKELADAFEVQNKNVTIGLFSVKGADFKECETASESVKAAYMKFRAFSKKNRIPKEEMDKAWKDALPVWEKFLTAGTYQMEDKAKDGLHLNCALALMWLGDYTKAQQYLDKVEDAKKGARRVELIESEPPLQPGTMLAFSEYAKNTQEMLTYFSEYSNRLIIKQ
jgi:tetratricopeptide (TPR) repeat protein